MKTNKMFSKPTKSILIDLQLIIGDNNSLYKLEVFISQILAVPNDPNQISNINKKNDFSSNFIFNIITYKFYMSSNSQTQNSSPIPAKDTTST